MAGLWACGGDVVVVPGQTSPSTGGESSTTTSTGEGGAGGDASCLEPHGDVHYLVRLYTFDGQTWGCDAAGTATGDVTIQGQVFSASFEHVVIDSCPPDGGCEPELSYLYVGTSDGLLAVPQLPLGTLVEVRVSVEQPLPCVHRIEIWNLPTWGGVSNPTWTDPWLLLAAADGSLEPLSDVPYALSKIPVGCYPGAPSCGDPKDEYILHFTDDTGVHAPLDVGGGQWAQDGMWEIRNLRAYSTGACDDYWNYAYQVDRWDLPL